MRKRLILLLVGALLALSSVSTAFADRPTPPLQVLRDVGDCSRTDKAEGCQVGGKILPGAGISWLATPPDHDPY